MMLDEITKIIGLAVYTPGGIFVGTADNIVLDPKDRKIDGIFVRGTNPVLVERGVSVNIPYRWVQSVGDVIILKMFPEKVTLDRGKE
jgi:sporulation protein YlmC with PRC-barrel domain